MKVYVAITGELGESDNILGVFSSSEKAIDFVQNYDQFLSQIDVEERELDSNEPTNFKVVYTQIRGRDGLFFLTEDGFERPLKDYKKQNTER